MLKLLDTKEFNGDDLAKLFHSVCWDIDTPDELLVRAMRNSSNVVSAWDGEMLIGIIRSMDDGSWSANIDCLIVHPDHQHKGIGTALVHALLEKIGHIKNISVCPSQKENNPFYERFGFEIIDGSSLLQIIK